ncbi:hypothetical protein IWQ61_007987 [Dispira simplex]|nr:hypothetical protein IWQ61_007987 [Dispira simplex]
MDYHLLGRITTYPCDENDEPQTVFVAERNDQFLQFTVEGDVAFKEHDPFIQKALTEENYEVIDDLPELLGCHHDDPVRIPVEEGDNVMEPVDYTKQVNRYSRLRFHTPCHSQVSRSDNLVQQLCLEETLGSLRQHQENTDHSFDSLTFIRQIADGLKFLHSHGIVHGDISSNTIHLRALDEPVISGFECAHGIGGRPRLSAEGSIMFASNIWGGVDLKNGDIGKTTNDVYALGSVIWSTVTRREPYSNMSLIQRDIEISESKTEDLEEVSDSALKEIISKCWEYCEINPIIKLLNKAIESSPESS